MESIFTSAIATIVGYLAKTLKEQKSIKAFFSDFTESTVNWIRPLFIEDEKEKELLQNLKEDPGEELYIKAIETALAIKLKKDPSGQHLLQEMVEAIQKKAGSVENIGNTMTITGNNGIGVQGVVGSTLNINQSPPKS